MHALVPEHLKRILCTRDVYLFHLCTLRSENYIVFRESTTRIGFNCGWFKSYSIRKPKNTRFLSSACGIFFSFGAPTCNNTIYINVEYSIIYTISYYVTHIDEQITHNIICIGVHENLIHRRRLLCVHVYYSRAGH